MALETRDTFPGLVKGGGMLRRGLCLMYTLLTRVRLRVVISKRCAGASEPRTIEP